jgi:hypothetical protein
LRSLTQKTKIWSHNVLTRRFGSYSFYKCSLFDNAQNPVSISALPQYKPIVFYGQGIKTAKGHCTIMSFLRNCTPLPYFSNPYLTFDGEKLGDEFGYVNYNVKWMRQNRFLLQSVGTEGQKCEFTEGSID